MQFSSVEFAIFFAIFFVAYRALSSRLRLSNCMLLAAGYFFYGWWDWRFLSLLVFTTVSTWGCALLAGCSHARFWTGTNIAINLAILLLFKYFDFFGDNLLRLFALLGWNVDAVTIEILLPIGISFYTFQSIAYSIDVYRGTVRAERSLLSFANFIAFFPQLLAGPIERASQLLPQINRPRRWDYPLAVEGARELLWGLFKKLAIADWCGFYVENVIGRDESCWMLAAAALLFSMQIYCDFSGYSNMARGMAAMLGFRLSVNFRYPFFAVNPADFWHRWHITLMNWFRDYVYFPLGGSRKGVWRTCLNIMVVFLLSGLWHGASWNFVMWGAAWGVIMVIYRLWYVCSASQSHHAATQPVLCAGDVTRITVMGYIVVLTFVLFMSSDLSQARTIIFNCWLPLLAIAVGGWCFAMLLVVAPRHRIACVVLLALAVVGVVLITFRLNIALFILILLLLPLYITVMLTVEWKERDCDFALYRVSGMLWKRMAVYWLLILAIVMSTTGKQFIYFQF